MTFEEEVEQSALEALAESCWLDHCPPEEVVLAAFSKGVLVGAIWACRGSDEWNIGVAEDQRGQGIATALVREAVRRGNAGFMVAGTEAGLGFLLSLQHSLTGDELEALDIPCHGYE